MTVKKIQMIPPGYTDILHPETDSSVVLMGDGNTLEQFKTTTNSEIAKKTDNSQFTKLLGANGWRKLPDGLIEQWGTVTIPSTAINVSTSATWTYPIPFTNCYHVSASFNPTASHFYTPTSCFSASSTQAKAYVTNGGTATQGWTVSFKAIGLP